MCLTVLQCFAVLNGYTWNFHRGKKRLLVEDSHVLLCFLSKGKTLRGFEDYIQYARGDTSHFYIYFKAGGKYITFCHNCLGGRLLAHARPCIVRKTPVMCCARSPRDFHVGCWLWTNETHRADHCSPERRGYMCFVSYTALYLLYIL